MKENKALYKLIKDTGTELGLHFDDGKIYNKDGYKAIDEYAISQPVVFTRKPSTYYDKRFCSSWSKMRIEPIISADADWNNLVLLAYISLPIYDSYDPDMAAEALDELSQSLYLFNNNYPAEAAHLFDFPMELSMPVWGEIIFEDPGNDEWPMLDLSNSIDLKLHIGVYESDNDEEFTAALDTLSSQTPIYEAIQDRMKDLARLFKHFRDEGDCQPPDLDLKLKRGSASGIFVSSPQNDGKNFVQ